ncbi:hypothetical protein F4561_003631 [Lipingzhangella halophila]|uniref:Uncharacterized protein n=1 Tax=Lipingzhangella halophila TaxID=1783352 RepID=A0A7W7RIW5_9ACTN|nr:hypothetical protein [Lipingzhangella halophila]MBB4932811.1 hypothetical protein [Lipingzhangella halophila]
MPRRITLPCTASTVLALSVGAKGVVMRPEALCPVTRQAAAATPRAFRTRLTAGEKPARTRMATLACVYDAEPAARRPHDVIAPPGGYRGRRRTPEPHGRGDEPGLSRPFGEAAQVGVELSVNKGISEVGQDVGGEHGLVDTAWSPDDDQLAALTLHSVLLKAREPGEFSGPVGPVGRG